MSGQETGDRRQEESDLSNRNRNGIKVSGDIAQNFNKPGCSMEETQIQDQAGATPPCVGVVVVSTDGDKKWVTKKYSSGRSLTMSLVNGTIVDKHMTYKV